MEGLGSIKRSGRKSGMAKLKGLNSIAKKGKSQLMAQRVNGKEMRTKGTKGLTSVQQEKLYGHKKDNGE